MLDPTTVAPGTTPAPTPMPTPAGNPNVDTPSGAPATMTTPNMRAQPSDNSNRPDASTPAANSIPAALVNNPQVPSQKLAAEVDANKNSTAPQHSMLYNKAIEMTGGQRYTTTTNPDGTLVRTPVEPKPWALGLALALDVLSGGMKGGTQPNGPAAFQAGEQSAQQVRDRVKQSNQDQDARAQADQKHKLDITYANMRNYQTAVASAKSGLEAATAYGDSYKGIADGLENQTIQLPQRASVSGRQWETDAMANFKNGKANATKDLLIPVGAPKPVLDANGQQLFQNGVPQFGHDYITVHGVGPDGKIPMSETMQKDFMAAGLMPDSPEGGIGQPMWSFSDIARKSANLASINAGEAILQAHKNDAHDYLDRDPEDLDDLKAAVKSDPRMSKAVQLFARAQQGVKSSVPGLTPSIADIFAAMDTVDAGASGLLKNYLKLTPKDLDDINLKRLESVAEAKDTKTHNPVEPKTMGDALAMKYNPASTPAQQKWADGVIAGFNEQEKNKADTAADAAQAKEDYKQGLKDQRTMGYVEDQNGDVYHVSRWQADHMPNYSAQTFIEKKPSDISADQKAIKPINDIQNNINGYRTANAAYDAAAKGNKVNVAGDRSNLTTIFSAPAVTDAASAHAGVEGFGMTIPTLAADLNKDLATKVLKAYNALSPEGKTMADSYARMRGAIPAYVKVITNAGRGSKEQLDIELQNIMPPYFNQSDIGHRIETFQGNLDTQKAGFPKNLAGSHFVATAGGPITVKAGGKTFSFQNQAAADAFKKQAGIQ